MDHIIDDIKSTVNSAVKKSGDLLEQGKVRLNLADANAKLSDLYEKLGEMAYQAHRNDKDCKDEMESAVWAIDEMLSEISKLNERLAELRSQKICASCGKANVDAADYCIKCGTKF